MAEPSEINVLIACEESQAECLAFIARGFNAFSCDIQPCRPGGRPERHIQGDVTPFLFGQTVFQTQDGTYHFVEQWNLVIAHPPCTYLSKVGSLHLYENPDTFLMCDGRQLSVNADRWNKMRAGERFFKMCLDAKADYLAVENPIPMKIAHLPRPDAWIDPTWFGVKYTKKTLYWLRNLPPIIPTIINPKAKCYVLCSRGKYRSRTFPEVAEALATQWGDYILSDINNKSNESSR